MTIKKLILLMFVVCGSETQQLKEGCTTAGRNEKCVPLKRCPEAIRALQSGIYPDTCGFQGNAPLVCCTTSAAIQESISQRKCREYSTFVPEFQIFAIVGGMDTEPREFPHMAALGYTNVDQITWQCGGSLVSENYVLTAAHCLTHSSYGRVSRVRLAVTTLPASTPTSNLPNTDYLISSIHPHPNYRSPSTYNDIALIRLARPAQFSSFVKPACLSNQPVTTDEEVVATGWGLTELGGDRSETLQKVEIEVSSGGECNKTYENMVGTRRLKEGIIQGQFCAVGKNSNHDTCSCHCGNNSILLTEVERVLLPSTMKTEIKLFTKGDSGGPLQTYILNERIWSIVGVTSFGKICGVSVPGVYTKVSYYLSWLESVIWPN